MGDERTVIRVLDEGVQHLRRRFVCIKEGWDSAFIFRFYDDELSFFPEELIGKTQEECMELFCKKDKEYLQS